MPKLKAKKQKYSTLFAQSRVAVLGDASHGGRSLDSLINYVNGKEGVMPKVVFVEGLKFHHENLVDWEDEATRRYLTEIKELTKFGIKVIGIETVDSSKVNDAYLANSRCTEANQQWAKMVGEYAAADKGQDKIAMCVGTAHLAFVKESGKVVTPLQDQLAPYFKKEEVHARAVGYYETEFTLPDDAIPNTRPVQVLTQLGEDDSDDESGSESSDSEV